MTTTTLLTGANRGIGLAVLTLLAQRPKQTIIAGVRAITEQVSTKIQSLEKGEGTKVIIAKLDASKPTDPLDAVAEVKRQGVERIDNIIANAGIGQEGVKVLDLDIDIVSSLLEVNVVGPWALLKAFKPLLQKSEKPQFIALSTALASFALRDKLPPIHSGAYGTSKAALNFFVHRLAVEETWLNAAVIHPGLVSTELGQNVADEIGKTFEELIASGTAVTVEHSAQKIASFLDGNVSWTSGAYIDVVKESPLPW